MSELQDVEFEGPLSKEALLKIMTKRELLLTDKYDDNDAWSILEKFTIVDRPPKSKSGKNVFVSRFNAKFEESSVQLIPNDGTSIMNVSGMKRKVGTAKNGDSRTSSVRAKLNANTCQARKGSTSRAPTLWEINGFPLAVQQNTVALKISKHLPRSLSKRAHEVGHFFLFVTERQQVWEKRKRGEYEPWSQSVALREYFFCNVSHA